MKAEERERSARGDREEGEEEERRKEEETNLDGGLVSSRDLRLSLDELVELGDVGLDLLPKNTQNTTRRERWSVSVERTRNETRRLTS